MDEAIEGLAGGAAEAEAALAGLRAAGENAAGALEATFGRVGDSIARELNRAASSGEFSFKRLFASIAADFVKSGVQTLFSAIGGALPGGGGAGGGLALFGARAEGGPVVSGRSFLVGERGPEVFTPAVSGRIGAGGGAQVSVTMNFAGPAGADAEQSVRRLRGQIMADLARAVADGSGRL